MRILISTDRYYPAISGVITSIMNLKKELEKEGHEVRVLTLSDTIHTYSSDYITYIGSISADIIYPDVSIKHPISKKLIEDLLSWKPDIIHANTEFSTYYIVKEVSRIGKIPMVLTYHTDYEDYLHYVNLGNNFGKKLLVNYVRYVSRHFNRVIAPTEKTKKQLMGYNIKPIIDVIPTGLDLDKFNVEFSGDELDEIRNKHNIDKNLPTLIFVGRLGKEKNLFEIIDNLKDFNLHKFQFVIVGGGPDEKEIQDYVKEAKLEEKVIFTGMVKQEEIVSYYALGDIFISASTSETQGLTFIEALSSGIPLLCKQDLCLEGIINQGQNGWTFRDKSEFCDCLDIMLSDKERLEKMKHHSKEDAKNRFGSEIFSKKILETYLRAIGQKNRPPRIPVVLKLYYKFKKMLPII